MGTGRLMIKTKIFTSRDLANIICRQYDYPPTIMLSLIHDVSLFNDRKLMRACDDSGITVYRIRAGQFVMQKIT